MSMTKIGVATLSDELLNYIKEQIKAGTLEWSDLIDTPDYTGQDGKFLQATSTGGSASMSWRDLPEMGISWGTQSTDVVAIDKRGYLASNGITITLPSNPEEGDLIAVTDANGEFDSTPVTVITVDGSLIESDTTLTLDLRNTFIQLIFDGTVWQISQLNSPFNVQEITEESFPGGQITYTLSRIPPNRSSVLITNAGKVVTTDKYSVVGNILTFGTVPVGTVYVRHIGVPSSVRVSDMPVGAMAYFPNGEDIDGWLDATGATISSSLYPDLVAYLTKDPGALTAKLPDPRGNFVRTWDHGSGLDTASQTVIPAYLKDNLWGKWLDTTDENTSANLWDGNTSTRTTVNKAQGYVGYRFDVPVKVDYANINSNDALGSAYLPTSMQLKASNDGVTWIVASNSVTGPFQGYTAQLVSNTSTPYRYWAVFGTGGSAYPTDATKYWGVTSLVFTGSTTNRLVGGFQMESVGTLSPTLNGSSAGAGSVQSGTGATALIVGGEGTSTGGTETRPDNQAYVLKIKAYHYQSGSLSDSNVTALRGEVSRLATLVEDSKSYVSPTPPAEPKLNSRWYDTTTGRTYIWFFDGDSYQWVDDSPQSTSSAAENINFAEVLTSGTTEERSLRERFGDLRNILDFGGRRNSTDDSKAAFDLAGNGPVFIPEGSYFVSSGDYSSGSYYSFGPVTVTGGATGIRVVNLGVTQVDSIKDLQGLVGTEGQQITVASYHDLSDLSGGGTFVWSIGRHNGGIFIDPTRAFPTDWNDQEQLAEYFADSGVDVNGWSKLTDNFDAKDFGLKSGIGIDNSIVLQKIHDTLDVFSVTGDEIEISQKFTISGSNKIINLTKAIFFSDLLPSDSSGLIIHITGDSNKIYGGNLVNAPFYSMLVSGSRNKIKYCASIDSTFSAFVDSGEDNNFELLTSDGAGWDAAQNSGVRAKWENCVSRKSKRHGFSTDVGSKDTEFSNCLALDTGGIDSPEGQDSYHFEGTSGDPKINNCRAVYTDEHPYLVVGQESKLQYVKAFQSVDSNVTGSGISVEFSDLFVSTCKSIISRPPLLVDIRNDNLTSSINVINGMFCEQESIIAYYGNGINVRLENANLKNVKFVKLFLQEGKLFIISSKLNSTVGGSLFRNGSSLVTETINYRLNSVYIDNKTEITGYDNIFHGVSKDCRLDNAVIHDIGSINGIAGDTSNASLVFDNFLVTNCDIKNVTDTLVKDLPNQTRNGYVFEGNSLSGTINKVREYNFSEITWRNNTISTTLSITNPDSGSGGDSVGINSSLISYDDANIQNPTTASPIGSRTPRFIGQEILNTTTGTWYKSVGLTNADWVTLN